MVAPVAMYAGGLLTRKTATTRNKTAMVWSCEFQVANMVEIFSNKFTKTSGIPVVVGFLVNVDVKFTK